MNNTQLMDYITSSRSSGQSDGQIKESLINAGWPEGDVVRHLSGNVPVPPGKYSMPGPISILKDSWAIFRKDIGKYLGLSFIFTIIPFIIAVIVLVPAIPSEVEARALGLSSLIGVGILGLLLGIFSYIGYVALLYMVAGKDKGITMWQSIVAGLKGFFPIAVMYLFIGIFVLFGFILLIIPGILFAIWYSQAVFIKAAEGRGIFDSIKRSKEYVKGSVVSVMYRVAFGAILFGIISGVLSAIISFKDIGSSLAQLIIAPIAMIYSFRLYEHLRDMHAKGLKSIVSTWKMVLACVLVIVFVGGGLWFVFSQVISGLDDARDRSDAFQSSLSQGPIIYSDDNIVCNDESNSPRDGADMDKMVAAAKYGANYIGYQVAPETYTKEMVKAALDAMLAALPASNPFATAILNTSYINFTLPNGTEASLTCTYRSE